MSSSSSSNSRSQVIVIIILALLTSVLFLRLPSNDTNNKTTTPQHAKNVISDGKSRVVPSALVDQFPSKASSTTRTNHQEDAVVGVAQQPSSSSSAAAAAWRGTSAIAPDSDAFSDARMAKLLNCTRGSQKGHFWNAREESCVEVPGFFSSPISSFEVSRYELSCSQQGKWVKGGYQGEPVSPSLSKQEASPTPSFSQSEEDLVRSRKQRFQNFLYHSSWMFQQWLPWKEIPTRTLSRLVAGDAAASAEQPQHRQQKQQTAGNETANLSESSSSSSPSSTPSASRAAEKFRYRAFHDPKLYNLYRIENFCIDPYNGFSGYRPKVESPYKGKDDTRNAYHGDRSISWFFSTVNEKLEEPPAFFDERPVIFMPIPPLSRRNLAHTFHRALSLLGILSSPEILAGAFDSEVGGGDEAASFDEGGGGENRGTTTRAEFPSSPVDDSTSLDNEDADGDDAAAAAGGDGGGANTDKKKNTIPRRKKKKVKPLIVFVSQSTVFDPYLKTVVPPAWGVHLRLLGLPWASISISGGTVEADYMKAMFRSTNKKKGFSMQGWNASSWCVRKSIVWQNCFSCIGIHAHTETEPYSFGNWVQVASIPPRMKMLLDYRRRFDLCLPQNFVASALSSSASPPSVHSQHLPRVFFDVRSHHRGLLDLGAFIPLIEARLQPFVSQILFREPWQSSRASYVDDVRSSDIFIGAHGAAFSHVALMRPGSYVIEFSHAIRMCNWTDDVLCWFGPFAQALDLHHWAVMIERTYRPSTKETENNAQMLKVPPSVIVEQIENAACRWLDGRISRRNRGGGGDSSNNKNGLSRYNQQHQQHHKPCWTGRNKNRWLNKQREVRSGGVIAADEHDASDRHNAQLMQDLLFVFGFGKMISFAEASELAERLRCLRLVKDRRQYVRVMAWPRVAWERVLEHWTDATMKITNFPNSGRHKLAPRSKLDDDVHCVGNNTLEYKLQPRRDLWCVHLAFQKMHTTVAPPPLSPEEVMQKKFRKFKRKPLE